LRKAFKDKKKTWLNIFEVSISFDIYQNFENSERKNRKFFAKNRPLIPNLKKLETDSFLVKAGNSSTFFKIREPIAQKFGSTFNLQKAGKNRKPNRFCSPVHRTF